MCSCESPATISSSDGYSSQVSSLSCQSNKLINARLHFSNSNSITRADLFEYRQSKMKNSTHMAPSGQNLDEHHTSDLSIRCLRFKYFFISMIFVVCLALLAASLATNKWLIARPIRVLRLANGPPGQPNANSRLPFALVASRDGSPEGRIPLEEDSATSRSYTSPMSEISEGNSDEKSTKFQGRIQFGLFGGTKVLNYGFGDRISQISVAQPFFTSDDNKSQTARSHEIISFRCWLPTLTGIVLAILFVLVGSIFAIINFVIVPQGVVAGQFGLVCLNSAACICSLASTVVWLFEYFTKLKWTVMTPEETQNGWTSEDRSQLGQSFYFVVAALMLHLVNIFIILVVHSKSWTDLHGSVKKNIERQSTSSACEGVIMLY